MSDYTREEYLAIEMECLELNKTINTLRGVINADDRRLKEAAFRVWGEDKHGCDTAEWMADEIMFLRKRNKLWQEKTLKLQAQLKAISSNATTVLETVMPKGT